MSNIKYEVHWVHHQLGVDKTHGVFGTLDKAIQSIYDWWTQNDYNPPYVHMWTVDGVTTLDYGFHHMFYKIKEIKETNELNPVVKFTKSEGAIAPKRGREADVAHDLFTDKDAVILPGRLGATVVTTGIRTAFDPNLYGLFINPRGGMMKYPLTLGNTQGVVEGEYRGDVGLPLKNTFSLQTYKTSTGEDGVNYSPAVLRINENGELSNISVKKAKQIYPEFESLALNQLRLLEADLSLVYGHNIYDTFREAFEFENLIIAGTIFIPKGTRLCQAFLLPRYATNFVEVDELDETERGEGAYGSSGVK